MFKRTIQVRIFRGESKYVAECLDLPVVTEGDTLDELASNIREAIALHLEGEVHFKDLAELGLSADPTILATMELDAGRRPAALRLGMGCHMTEDSVVRELPGAQDVIAWFGYWPYCHDWELLSLVLNRKGTSLCRLFGFHRTDETDAAGVFIRVKHAIVTFEMDDVFDLSLVEFNQQNVINSLVIERTKSEIPPHGKGFRIMFGPCWGLNGYLAAERMRVKLSPGQPSASE